MNNPVKKCIWCGSTIQSARSNKKICNDRCKMQSFYSRQSCTANPEGKAFGSTVEPLAEQNVLPEAFSDTGKNSLPKSEHTATFQKNAIQSSFSYCNPVALNVQRFSPNAADINVNGKKEVTSKTPPARKQEETPYNWIYSPLIDKVAELVEQSPALIRFLYPDDYFSAFDMEKIKWVTTLLRSITEHLLCLSEQPQVSRAVFEHLRQAIESLIASSNFRSLPCKYPLTSFAGELACKLAALGTKHQRQKYFVLRLKPVTKAELIARRYEMAALVNAFKLSELEFTQPGSMKR